MKKLVFAALLCGGIAQMGTGCIITTSDDGPDPNVVYDGTISASWLLVSGDDNTPVGCPAGATTMEVITDDLAGNQIVDKYDCIDNAGVLDRRPGTYDIWARLTDDSSIFTYAQSTLTTVTVEEALDTGADFEISIDRGSFFLTWQITDGGLDSSCDAPGIGDISVATTIVGDPGSLEDDVAPCELYKYTTPGLPLADYTVAVSLLDADNVGAVYQAPAQTASLEYGNQFYDLGNFTLDAAGM